jgi:cell division protein FtsI (penicillin-binding protein 3)
MWLLLILLALFGLVVASYYRLQILENQKWIKEALRQHYLVIKEPFMRGSFISNSSIKTNHLLRDHKFVSDIEKFHLHIDPKAIPESQHAVVIKNILANLDNCQTDEAFLREQLEKKSRNRKLASWLEKSQRDAILKWWHPFAKSQRIPHNALFFVADYQRSYPFGKLLGQLLHTTRGFKEESTQNSTPTGGLELQFDSYLSGHQGKRQLMRSPKNAFEMGEVIEYPENGKDIYLTINHYLQAIVEDELEKGVQRSRAKGGWVVMMQPQTGEILAIAQYPFFNPADCHRYFNDPRLAEDTQLKAVSYAYEPGSVTKSITLYIALLANKTLVERGEQPLFNPDEMVATTDGRFPGRSRPLSDTSLHRYLNAMMAIQKSATIYNARLAEKIVARLGSQWYREQLHEIFGFGKKTGIEFPCETSGMLPMIGKKYSNGTLEWSASTPYSLAIGYNYQVNSLQMLRAYAMFANGGYYITPTLLRKIVKTDADGKQIVLVDNTLPDRLKAFPKHLDSEILNTVNKALKYTTKPGGTGSRGDIRGYSEAGKTSTSKKLVNGAYSENLYRCSFIGYAPWKNPAFVLYVVIDEPRYGYLPGIGKFHNGGLAAALIFRTIGKRTLEYLGVAPDDPYGYPNGDPRYDKEKGDWFPEANQLLQLYNKWNRPNS